MSRSVTITALIEATDLLPGDFFIVVTAEGTFKVSLSVLREVL